MKSYDLARMLHADRISRGERRTRPRFFGDDLWKFQIILRHYEYWLLQTGILAKLIRGFWHYRFYQQSIRLNFEIPPHVFAAGLSIAHRGPIIVNPNARIGENCRIHSGVNIGTAAGKQTAAPSIGDDCYIGPGVKIFGAISIANDVAMAAQAVINKSCTRGNVTLGGVPAKVIAERGAAEYIIAGSRIYDESLSAK
jgi:serine O-acetyltransferase